ncbi:MAG: hypothetical protein ACF788_01200 [Novipirellula sp. JB048]
MKSYDQLAANIAAIEKMGTWIAKSQMFGCGSVDQGCVIAMDCYITGMPLLEYQKRNMLVSGRPSIPYDAMIAAFQEAGGKLKVIEKSPEAARIELTFDGNTTPFTFTWEEALKEPLPYAGKEADIVTMLAAGKTPKLKSKYATPRSRAVMLFARVASDGIRTVAASVNFGRYTPEEISDFGEVHNAPSQPSSTADATGSSAPVETPKPTPTPTATAADHGSVAEASEAGKVSSPVVDGRVVDDRTSMHTSEPANEDQKAKVIDLMKSLVQSGISDIGQRVASKLKESGIEGGVLGLTYAEAEKLIVALQNKEVEAWCNSTLTGYQPAKNG